MEPIESRCEKARFLQTFLTSNFFVSRCPPSSRCDRVFIIIIHIDCYYSLNNPMVNEGLLWITCKMQLCLCQTPLEINYVRERANKRTNEPSGHFCFLRAGERLVVIMRRVNCGCQQSFYANVYLVMLSTRSSTSNCF